MSKPRRPEVSAEEQAFGRAVCERLGIDPAIVSDDLRASLTGDDEFGEVTLTAFIPADELITLFLASGLKPTVL